MKYVDEYRDGDAVRKLADTVHKRASREWNIMEICGGQTHSIVKFGLDQLLPRSINLVHGPGCPVCVTPLELIDQALAIARRPEVIFTSFGDMLRVPGSESDLLRVKSEGGDVRIVYGPLDAVTTAAENPGREVVFFAVGFETTAPANAMAVAQARKLGLSNFSILSSHVLVPPAIEAILGAPDCRLDAFLAAGHVCTVEGYVDYEPLAARFNSPIVVTGFEPVDLMLGILSAVTALEEGRNQVENAYKRSVRREGNPAAKKLVHSVFEVCDRNWRGIGEIPKSGLRVNDEHAPFDASLRFATGDIRVKEPEACIAGQVLMGVKKPSECPAFGSACTPDTPLGAPMVSAEGACSAYYTYRRSD